MRAKSLRKLSSNQCLLPWLTLCVVAVDARCEGHITSPSGSLEVWIIHLRSLDWCFRILLWCSEKGNWSGWRKKWSHKVHFLESMLQRRGHEKYFLRLNFDFFFLKEIYTEAPGLAYIWQITLCLSLSPDLSLRCVMYQLIPLQNCAHFLAAKKQL